MSPASRAIAPSAGTSSTSCSSTRTRPAKSSSLEPASPPNARRPGDNQGGASCGKILLVGLYRKADPSQVHRVYAIIDEQSKASLITSELANALGEDTPSTKYYLSTCTRDNQEKYGQWLSDIVVKSLDGVQADLPTLIECDSISQDKREIPTPEMARRFIHLKEITNEIPPFDQTAGVHIFIGRNAPELLKVRAFKNGGKEEPWAQHLYLGWTITGQMCLDLASGPAHVVAHRTALYPQYQSNGSIQPTEFHDHLELQPCPRQFRVKASLIEQDLNKDVFALTKEDNNPGLSCEDHRFMEEMESNIHKNKTGHWEMPLPFRQENPHMPNNKIQATNRLNGLLRTLKRNPKMETEYLEFMEKVIDKGHASPVDQQNLQTKPGKLWYLPHFRVRHPKKKSLRIVFNLSAEFKGASLNKQLLPGPDLMNSLLGVLKRFRRENYAIMCNIEQMFHSFYVNPEHRDFLCFLWFRDNDPKQPIIDYRMNVHLLGNGPSPAVAMLGLRKTVDGEEKFSSEVKNFVCRNIFVDDGIVSKPSASEAINLVRDTQAALATANLRLHKLCRSDASLPYQRQGERHQRSRPQPQCVTYTEIPWSMLGLRER